MASSTYTTSLPLDDLIDSSSDLNERFRGGPAERSQALKRFMEEVGELVFAVGTDEFAPISTRPNIAEEAVDVLVTLFGVIASCQIQDRHLAEMMHKVIEKNDAKTLETHHLAEDGKIRKKPIVAPK